MSGSVQDADPQRTVLERRLAVGRHEGQDVVCRHRGTGPGGCDRRPQRTADARRLDLGAHQRDERGLGITGDHRVRLVHRQRDPDRGAEPSRVPRVVGVAVGREHRADGQAALGDLREDGVRHARTRVHDDGVAPHRDHVAGRAEHR